MIGPTKRYWRRISWLHVRARASALRNGSVIGLYTGPSRLNTWHSKRMDNVGIVVDDLGQTIYFFRELGLELKGHATIRLPFKGNDWYSALHLREGLHADNISGKQRTVEAVEVRHGCYQRDRRPYPGHVVDAVIARRTDHAKPRPYICECGPLTCGPAGSSVSLSPAGSITF
jgi:hypothetical protein